MKTHVILPASGVGIRFGSLQPKQYFEIKNTTVMEWTLQVWQQTQFNGRVILVLSADDTRGADIAGLHPSLEIVAGGATRSDTVLNALAFLAETEDLNDWVMVHDIARPCVRIEDIHRLQEHCQQTNSGAILATPLTDTIKHRDTNDTTTTIDRSALWAAQTPQCFKLGQLINALMSAKQHSFEVTDEASAIEYIKGTVQLLEGSRDNIKLTNPSDARLIEFYLTEQGL